MALGKFVATHERGHELRRSVGRSANRAAALIAEGALERLLGPVQANEVFVRCTAAERTALRAQGFGFYDWGSGAARFVAAWDSREEDAAALGRAIAAL